MTQIKKIITVFYRAQTEYDPDSLYKAGEYCRDHPELKWDVQAIIFFHDAIEQRYLAMQRDPDMTQKNQAAQDNVDNMLVQGRGISEFDPLRMDRKVRDYCLGRLYDIQRIPSDPRAADARYHLMTWYLCQADFVTSVHYFSMAAKSGCQASQFGLPELISLLKDNPIDMDGWENKKLMEFVQRRANRITYSQSSEYDAIWAQKNRLLVYKKYLALEAEQGYVPAEFKLLTLNAEEDSHTAFLLADLFHDGSSRYKIEPDQYQSQKYLAMAAQKNHNGAMRKYLSLWRGDALLPDFFKLETCYTYEDHIEKEDALIAQALKKLEDYQSGRVKADEY